MNRFQINNLSRDENGRPRLLLRGAIIGIFLGLGVTIFVLLSGPPDLYRKIEEMTDENRYEEAEQLASSLHEQDPLDVKPLLLLGRNAFRKAYSYDNEKRDKTEEGWNLYQSAVEAFKKAILLDKDGLMGSTDYFILAFAYLRKGDQYFEESLRYLKLAESLNTNDHLLSKGKDPILRLETLQQMMGYLNYHLGNYTNAVDYYRLANNQKPNVLDHAYIGLCEVAIGEYSNALKTFELVRDYANQEGLRAFAIRQLAWTFFHLGDYQNARVWFESAVSADTNYAEGYYWLGKLAELNSQLGDAREYWQKSLELDPHFGPAILKLQFSPQHRTN